MRLPNSLLLLTLLGAASAGRAVAQDVTVGAQVRPRTEFREPVAGGDDAFTSMRVRASVDAALERNVRVYLEVQDVRIWGEESNTLGDFNADNFDLHQGFVQLASSDQRWMARAGRQEMNLGGQRLVGAVDWTQQGRAFDGVRAGAGGSWGGATVFGFLLGDATSPGIDEDGAFIGAHASVKKVPGGTLELYALYEHADALMADTDEATFGLRLVGKQGGLIYRGEVYLQTGERDGSDVEAFMVGTRVGTTFANGKGRITLWYDYLSGDDDPTDSETTVFNTLFATNHKFYGYADLFLNIPVHTGGMGLQDAAIKGAYAVRKNLSLHADLHSFHLAKRGALTTKHLGEELDLTGRYTYTSNLTFTGGVSLVFAAAGLDEIGRLDENMTWAYVMVDASF